MTEQEFSIYALPNYAIRKTAFNSVKHVYNLNTIVSVLTTNKGFHFRINPATKYIFFADIDNFEDDINIFKNDIYAVIKNDYGIILDENDFKYTRNISKAGSYHISIPKIYGVPEEFISIQQSLIKLKPDVYKKNGKYIVDASIYHEHWFRCPYQLKENIPNTQHIIVVGEMCDFIIEYIPGNSIKL